MKIALLLIILFINFYSSGQNPDKKANGWDSLFARNKLELQRYDDILHQQLYSTDTVKEKNTIIITHFARNGNKLQKITYNLDSANCARGIYRQFYNTEGLICYAFDYRKFCPQAGDDNNDRFERVTYYERYAYDAKGNAILHVFHVSTPGTFRETYTYAPDGARQTKREQIAETAFWK